MWFITEVHCTVQQGCNCIFMQCKKPLVNKSPLREQFSLTSVSLLLLHPTNKHGYGWSLDGSKPLVIITFYSEFPLSWGCQRTSPGTWLRYHVGGGGGPDQEEYCYSSGAHGNEEQQVLISSEPCLFVSLVLFLKILHAAIIDDALFVFVSLC